MLKPQTKYQQKKHTLKKYRLDYIEEKPGWITVARKEAYNNLSRDQFVQFMLEMSWGSWLKHYGYKVA